MKALLICLYFFLFLFILLPKTFAAVTINITNPPSSVAINEEFNVSFAASGLEANTQYYGKIRLGTGSTYTKGETKKGDIWLDDNDPWTSFPTLTSDTPGGLNAFFTGRAKSTANLGTNQLFVRLRKVGTTDNITSDGVNIDITQSSTPLPTSTPTPLSSPTPVPTSKPTSTKSPTKTAATPTPTQKISSQIPSARQVLNAAINPKINIPTSVLGQSTKSATATQSAGAMESNKEVKTLGSSQNNIFRILIGLGIAIFVFSCAILLFQHFKNKKINNE